MKFVNLFTGKKTLIEENYKSFKNLQFNNYEQNYNFTINRCLPTNLIAKKDKRLFLRALYSREKGSRYISLNYSNYLSNNSKINESDKLLKSLLIRFIYYFVDFFERVKFFLKNLN